MAARIPAPEPLCSATVQRLIALPRRERIRLIKSLPQRQALAMLHDWSIWAREKQLWRPGEEKVTAILAGRGWGKNETGAHAVHHVAEHPYLCGGRKPRGPGDRSYGEGGQMGIAGRTANDVNETILYGPSGIMTTAPPWAKPKHLPSRKLLVWPNGCVAHLMSGDVPESFRGKNLGWLWADELAFWRRLKRAWQAATLALRHGERPRCLITTTPLGTSYLLEIIFLHVDGGMVEAAADDEHQLQGWKLNPTVRVVTGSTYENAANLARGFMTDTVASFEGSELGDQELRGVVLFQRTGAMWKRDWIRRCELEDVPDLVATCIAIDPSISDGETTTEGDPCECGIVAMGIAASGALYVLEDGSGIMTPPQWCARAMELAERWEISDFAFEINQGGRSLIESAMREHAPRKVGFRYHPVRATKSKAGRAALVVSMWSAGRVRHVGHPRRFTKMEHQLCTFDPQRPKGSQPTDRMDALVWGSLHLAGDGTDRRRLKALSDPDAMRKIAEEVRRRRALR